MVERHQIQLLTLLDLALLHAKSAVRRHHRNLILLRRIHQREHINRAALDFAAEPRRPRDVADEHRLDAQFLEQLGDRVDRLRVRRAGADGVHGRGEIAHCGGTVTRSGSSCVAILREIYAHGTGMQKAECRIEKPVPPRRIRGRVSSFCLLPSAFRCSARESRRHDPFPTRVGGPPPEVPLQAVKARLLELIDKHWGYDTLRPLQEEAMLAALDSRDSLVVMPTGGGKSLCYQAPAVLQDRVTVVVSPLISLMKDQVDGLIACGVPAAQMNSSLPLTEVRAVERDVLRGDVKLLFVSPERMSVPYFREMLRRADVKTFAIDEAHCISHWGHDFRPEYRQLRTLRDEFPDASMHAYTATATPEVRRDIVTQLGLRDPLVLVGDFDRPNLTYRVLPRHDEAKQVLDVIERHRGEAGIIYCTRRRDVDSLAEKLQKRGHHAVAYHAGLTQEERRVAQDAFAKEQCDLVVATVAFGMGIDRSNVRFVLHTAMPKSVEHYQQESGRAGRDGLEAECVLLYSGADPMLWRSMLKTETSDSAHADSLLRHLNDMDRYCSGAACRHRALVEYFGQKFTGDCNACDICLGETEEVSDALTIAQKIVSCVYRLRESWGVSHVVGVLRGEDTEKIRERHHNELSTYGLLKGYTRQDVREWIYQLIAQEFLAQSDGEYPILRLGTRSREVLRGFADVRLRQPAVKKADATNKRATRTPLDDLAAYDRDLFETLRMWRRREAEERGVPPYVIFSDRTLRELARVRPTTPYELRGIYGIGDTKLEAFGDAIVHLVRGAASLE
ncbi:MAG: DNA helicase RecQ [Acidobacteria bacterium]|nr:MAG: DNA helicase RecQ [Acidobacteriota bacterium]